MNRPVTAKDSLLSVSLEGLELMVQALTHSSYANEKKVESNERLELLGDAVISLACIDYLYKKYPTHNEGSLTQLKTNLVNGKQLAEIGEYFHLDKHVRLGNGEVISKKTVGRAVEAVVGAFFLSEGYEKTKLKLTALFEKVESGEIKQVATNYKGRIQEYSQIHYKVDPCYTCVLITGPDHKRTYHVVVTIPGSKDSGDGAGTSLKEAEQDAARELLSVISANSVILRR